MRSSCFLELSSGNTLATQVISEELSIPHQMAHASLQGRVCPYSQYTSYIKHHNRLNRCYTSSIPGVVRDAHADTSSTKGISVPSLNFVDLRFSAIQVWVPIWIVLYLLPSES